MIEAIGKYVGGKVITAIIVVTSAVILIWIWQMSPEQRGAIVDTIKHSAIWVGFAAALPWAFFFVPPMAVKAESNLVSALVLVGYMLLDMLMAFYLAGWSPGGTLTWAVMILGFLCAAVYNFVVTDFLADRADDAM
jgi:hypothetical protein